MLEKLRCSASSIDLNAKSWDTTSFFDCDDGNSQECQERDQSELDAAINESEESPTTKRGDDGDEIFALEFSDELEIRRPF